MKTAGIAIAVLAGFVALWLLGAAFGIVGGVTDRVANPDRMVGVYERFFDRCASVQALENQRDNVTAQLESTNPEDAKEVNRLRAALQAVESQRARTISQYNADADAPTRSFLRSSGLPAELDVKAQETECAR